MIGNHIISPALGQIRFEILGPLTITVPTWGIATPPYDDPPFPRPRVILHDLSPRHVNGYRLLASAAIFLLCARSTLHNSLVAFERSPTRRSEILPWVFAIDACPERLLDRPPQPSTQNAFRKQGCTSPHLATAASFLSCQLSSPSFDVPSNISLSPASMALA